MLQVNRLERDQIVVVSETQGVVEQMTLEDDPGVAVAAGHLVVDTLDGDDVVGGDVAAQMEDEAAAQIGVAVGEA